MPASGANNNKFMTVQTIANQALVTLYESLVVRPLIHTDLTKQFTAGVGDTINVRKPAVFTAKKFNRATGIDIQTPSEDSIPIKLDNFLDTSFEVTSEQLALDISDFDAQLLTPAMEALTEGVEKQLIETLLNGTTQSVGGLEGFTWNMPESLLMAGAILDRNKVPAADRATVVGPIMKAYWNNSIHIKNAEKSGSTEALRRASLGRDVFGFETYRSSNIAPDLGDSLDTEIGVAFHKSAMAFGSATLPLPSGAEGAIASYKGLSLRVVKQYDINRKSDVISVDILFGAKVLDPKRIVLIKKDAQDAEESSPDVAKTITLPKGVTGGTFTLTIGRQTTDPIEHNATAEAVATAINKLSNVSNAQVTGSAGGPYKLTGVKQGITGAGTGLTGGSNTTIDVK